MQSLLFTHADPSLTALKYHLFCRLPRCAETNTTNDSRHTIDVQTQPHSQHIGTFSAWKKHVIHEYNGKADLTVLR